STPTDALMDLCQFALNYENNLHELGGIIRERLYEPLSEILWRRDERYSFEMWREYEIALPPALVIESQPGNPSGVFKPLQPWSHDSSTEVNTFIALEDFTVERITPHRKSVFLCAGRGSEAVNFASRVEVTGFNNQELHKFSPGQKIPRIQGKVI